MAKGGIQLFVVVVVGTAVAYAFRREESERDHRRRLDEYRRGVLLELVEAYNRIKEVRRTLRAYGFRSPRSDTQSADTLSADQSNEFQTQMRVLAKAQLSLEKIRREIGAQPQIFRTHGDDRIECLIRKAGDYVNKVVDDWEKSGVTIVAGADAHLLDDKDNFKNLQAFLDRARHGQFEQEVSDPVECVERLIQDRLLGS